MSQEESQHQANINNQENRSHFMDKDELENLIGQQIANAIPRIVEAMRRAIPAISNNIPREEDDEHNSCDIRQISNSKKKLTRFKLIHDLNICFSINHSI